MIKEDAINLVNQALEKKKAKVIASIERQIQEACNDAPGGYGNHGICVYIDNFYVEAVKEYFSTFDLEIRPFPVDTQDWYKTHYEMAKADPLKAAEEYQTIIRYRHTTGITIKW